MSYYVPSPKDGSSRSTEEQRRLTGKCYRTDLCIISPPRMTTLLQLHKLPEVTRHRKQGTLLNGKNLCIILDKQLHPLRSTGKDAVISLEITVIAKTCALTRDQQGPAPLTSQVDTNHQLQILSLAPLSPGCLLLGWSPDPVQKPMPQFTRPHSRRGGRGASCRALKPAFLHQARKLQTRFEASFSPRSRRWGWRLPAAGHAAASPLSPLSKSISSSVCCTPGTAPG